MSIRLLAALVLWAGCAADAAAQAALDTTFALPGVTVTATRTETAASAVPSRVTVLDAAAAEASGATTVAELLEARGGLFVKRYGGGLATLSLRGTGAAQTLVLLDGLRIADPQLGQLDLSLLPTLLLDGVELMHGSGAALYGTDGLGGVVNLRTGVPGTAGGLRLMARAGAYGERAGGVRWSGGTERLSAVVLAEYDAADGDFSYTNTALFPSRTVRRDNADHRRRALYGSLRYAAGRHRLRLAGWYNDAERGLPGLATAPTQGERQWDEHLRFWAEHEVRLPAGQLQVRGLVQRGALRYQHPGLGVDDTGRTLVSSAEATLQRVAGRRWLLAGGFSTGYGRADHPALADDATDVQAAAFTHATGQYGRLLLYPALRFDVHAPSGGGTRGALSPRLGVNVEPWAGRPWHLKASAGRAFRMPTFNDRFWQPGGDPDLRPEHGWAYDAGVFVAGLRHQVEVTVFASHTSDQIVWSPTAAGHHAPANVSRTRAFGFEASWQGGGRVVGLPVTGGALYAYTDARDRSDPGARSFGRPLRYVPREQAKAFAGVRMGPLHVDAGARYTGRRYITTDGVQYLDPYVVLDLHLRLEGSLAGTHAALALTLDNILNHRYEVVRHYPMPPRHARLRLTVDV